MEYKRVELKNPVLGLYPVYIEDVYNGHEPFKVVGIREGSIELRGDWSGGTHAFSGDEWIGLERCFIVKEVCPESERPGGCQMPNIRCCGGGRVVEKHVEWWKESKLIRDEKKNRLDS